MELPESSSLSKENTPPQIIEQLNHFRQISGYYYFAQTNTPIALYGFQIKIPQENTTTGKLARAGSSYKQRDFLSKSDWNILSEDNVK